MYVSPMMLFILAEILVVSIVIGFFLFSKSRLYKVLLGIHHELRIKNAEKRLGSHKATNLQPAKFSLTNVSHSEKASEKRPPTLAELLQAHVSKLPEHSNLSKTSLPKMSDQQKAEWLRQSMLRLELDMLQGEINSTQWQAQTRDILTKLLPPTFKGEESQGSSDDGVRPEQDSETTNEALSEARQQISALESELERMKSISSPIESHIDTPKQGMYEDEIYQLKCNNFDLQESINELKLRLQSTDPSEDSSEFIAMLETQISNLEQYIRSADVAMGLMEKELAASAKKDNATAQTSHSEETASRPPQNNSTGDEPESSPQDVKDSSEEQAPTLNSLDENASTAETGTEPTANKELEEPEVEADVVQDTNLETEPEPDLNTNSESKTESIDELESSNSTLDEADTAVEQSHPSSGEPPIMIDIELEEPEKNN